MQPRLRMLLLLLAAALVTDTAQAICGGYPPVRTWPRPPSVVPRNVHIATMMPSDFQEGTTLSLRTAPVRGKESVVVPVAERSWRGGLSEYVELVPGATLPARTAFEVRSTRDEILAVFTTGDDVDTTPPSWGGLKDGTVWHPPRKSAAKVIPLECGSSLVTLHMESAATDDRTGAKDILYALWAVPAARSIDYSTPPLGWVDLDVERARLYARPGVPSDYTLDYGNDQEELNTIALPLDRPLKVGVRAIDLAGNASPPSELTLE